MNQSSKRWVSCGLVCAMLLCASGDAWAGRGGGSSGSMQKYMKQQQQAMQMQQKAMMEAMARQAAIQKQIRDNYSKASKARHEKEDQHRQDAIEKRKAEQATKGTDTPAATKK